MVCGLVAMYLSDKLKRGIEVWGTALIGAFLLVRGVGMYAPGYPSEFSPPEKDINNK